MQFGTLGDGANDPAAPPSPHCHPMIVWPRLSAADAESVAEPPEATVVGDALAETDRMCPTGSTLRMVEALALMDDGPAQVAITESVIWWTESLTLLGAV